MKLQTNAKNNLEEFFSNNPNLAPDQDKKSELSSIDRKSKGISNPLITPKMNSSPKGMTSALHDISAIDGSVSDK